MVGVRGVAILVALVLACIAGSPMVAGDYTETESYGPTPPCVVDGVVQNCDWYGFVNNLFPAEGASCLVETRMVLSNTSLEGTLLPDEYYTLNKYVYDNSTHASYCLYGCFDSNASAPAPAPGNAQAPPPGFTPAPPSPSTPPATTSAPASAPASPPASASAPASDPDSPPGLIAPPSPPASSPPATPTPPNGTPRIFNLNGAGFLQPTGLLSFMISAALLIFNGLVAF